LRSFKIVCPFCENFYPFPENFDEIYRCRCGAVYKIIWESDMEDAMNQLTHFFLKGESSLRNRSKDDVLYHAVVYEDIQDLIRMKTEYESVKYIRKIQSFDHNYPQKVRLVWLGNYIVNRLSF
jgi:negative regulator of genetic competence, sporulation and motility